MESKLSPAFKSNHNIPIIFAADNNYVAYLSVALLSLIENTTGDYFYDILIFNKDITVMNKEKLQTIGESKNNISIRFIDMLPYIENLNLPVVNYYSIEIYFRLFMPYLLSEYEKAIYLDSDLVVVQNIALLWEIELEPTSVIGAVRDIGMILHYNTTGKEYVPMEYFEDVLSEVNANNYFNSGVLIINLKKFKENISFEQIYTTISQKQWKFPDQDVLNVLCKEKTTFLSNKWNTVPYTTGNRIAENILMDVPEIYGKDYFSARSNPGIVHYAMWEKPWKYKINLDFELFDYFWRIAVKSPYFTQIIKNKKRNCSLAELVFIFEQYTQKQMSKKYGCDDIHYIVGKWWMGKLSNCPVKYDIIKIKEHELIVEGSIKLLESGLEDMDFYMKANENMIKCKIFDRYEDEIFGIENRTMGKTIGFKAVIPLDKTVEVYQIRLLCIVENVQIFMGCVNYGRFSPIDKVICGQYYESNGYILTVNKNNLVLKSNFQKIKHEIQYLKELWKRKEKKYKKAGLVRILLSILKKIEKRRIWLIADNFLMDDNGMAFFKFMEGNDSKYQKTYLVMSKNNEKYREIKSKWKGKVLTYESKLFKIMLLLSKGSITSVYDKRLINPFGFDNGAYRDILADRKHIFLQHGVITQDLSREHNKYCYNPSGFLTSSRLEYQSLLGEKYFYTENEIWLTGLPRFDLLYHDEKRYITIIPTWRAYLMKVGKNGKKQITENFKQSNFFKFYNALLHDEKLQKAVKFYNYTLCLRLHPLMKDSIDAFKESGESFLELNGSYRDVYAQSDLIISDYSSAIFDFLYLRKPILYAHFDKEEFFSGAHCYDKGYHDYEQDGFGEVCYDVESLVDILIEYMKDGCQLKDKYRDRVDNFFAYNDRNNCRRVYEKIKELK